MKYPPTIYVIGTDRNIGKTVTCIGIISNLIASGQRITAEDIGYIKPVGQQTLTVLNGDGQPVESDKDAVVALSLLGIQGPSYEYLSPVVWADGVTSRYIDDALTRDPLAGRRAFVDRIQDAYQRVAAGKRVVLAEGTGHPGVGSVGGISNADVINLLRGMGVPLNVLLVTRGGIGATIDQVFPYLVLLDHMHVRVEGMIVNGVYPSKMDKIRRYLTDYYERVFPVLYGDVLKEQGVPRIVGFVPSVDDLRRPTMRLIQETLAHKDPSIVEVVAPQDFDHAALALVRNVKVISLDFGFEPFLEPGDAVVVGVNSNDVILAVLLLHERMVRIHGQGLSGLILSCRQAGGLSRQIQELVASSELPTMLVALDSASIVQRIENMDVKIQPYDVGKRALIAEAFRDLNLLPGLNV